MIDWALEHRYLLLILALLIVAGVVGYAIIQRRRRTQAVQVVATPLVADQSEDSGPRPFTESAAHACGLGSLPVIELGG